MPNAALAARLRRSATKPVSDAARDDIASRLNDAYTRGGLDTDSYQRLLAQAFAARTCAELAPVADELPTDAVSNLPDIVRQGSQPGQLAPIRGGGSAGRRLVVVAVPVVVVAVGFIALLAHLLGLF